MPDIDAEAVQVAQAAQAAEARAELRAVAREMLGKSPAPSWSALAAAGWTGLEVPESLDGAGASFAETAVIAAELGRAASGAVFLGPAVLGVGTLLALSPSPSRDDLLRAAATGAAVPLAVLAGGSVLAGAAGRAAGREAPFRLEHAADGRLRLHGSAPFVPDAGSADRLLLLARGPDAPLCVVAVCPGTTGLVVEAQPVVDETRRLARVTADGVEAPETSVWQFTGDPAAAVASLLDRAAVAMACDSLGIAEAMLERTVAYVKVREQFGRPVGSFQAVQHACADMLVALRASRELVGAAVSAIAEAGLDAEPDAGAAAAMAASYACAAAVDIAGTAMQLHGGIGYTWESGIHAYLKRAALNRSLFGSPAQHRERLATRYRFGDPEPAMASR